jgi:hypothetical protein
MCFGANIIILATFLFDDIGDHIIEYWPDPVDICRLTTDPKGGICIIPMMRSMLSKPLSKIGILRISEDLLEEISHGHNHQKAYILLNP